MESLSESVYDNIVSTAILTWSSPPALCQAPVFLTPILSMPLHMIAMADIQIRGMVKQLSTELRSDANQQLSGVIISQPLTLRSLPPKPVDLSRHYVEGNPKDYTWRK